MLKLGVINVYVFLFFKYWGGVFVYYVIMNGEEEIGVMIMEMIKKMDVGGIYV